MVATLQAFVYASVLCVCVCVLARVHCIAARIVNWRSGEETVSSLDGGDGGRASARHVGSVDY